MTPEPAGNLIPETADRDCREAAERCTYRYRGTDRNGHGRYGTWRTRRSASPPRSSSGTGGAGVSWPSSPETAPCPRERTRSCKSQGSADGQVNAGVSADTRLPGRPRAAPNAAMR